MQGVRDAGVIRQRLLRVERRRGSQDECKRGGGRGDTGRRPKRNVACLHWILRKGMFQAREVLTVNPETGPASSRRNVKYQPRA